jgi:hypothetical protein
VVEFLSTRHIPHIVRDVRWEPASLWDFWSRGLRGTPVTLIGDTVICGFDRQRLEEKLGARSNDAASAQILRGP